jgi:FkbM family methyltransferase
MKIADLYKKFIQKKISKQNYIKQSQKNKEKLFEFKDFLTDSKVKEIRISTHLIQFDIESCIKNKIITMNLDLKDSRFIPYEIFNFKSFEPDVANYLFHVAKKSTHIVDIGANIGWYSLNFNLLNNTKSIHSFEVIPRTYNFLKDHLKINNAKKVKANNIALSNKKGKVPFFWTESETGSASMKNNQNRKRINRIECKTITLDEYANNKLKKIDLIKCDVEGSELLVFQGSRNILSKFKPVIFTEMLRKWSAKFNYHPNDIINFLAQFGYKCYSIKNKEFKEVKKITEQTEQTNFFFLHILKHKALLSSLKNFKDK